MKGQCVPEYFKAIDETISMAVLDNHEGSVFAVSGTFNLVYINPWWTRFSEENSGDQEIASRWGIGSDIFLAISDVLRPFYQDLFALAAKHSTNPPLLHAYECSGPDIFREFLMQIYPLRSVSGFLVVNSLRKEFSFQEKSIAVLPANYRGADGSLAQCCHCRRYENIMHASWDWVPQWVASTPANVCQTMCPVCLDYHYPIRRRN